MSELFPRDIRVSLFRVCPRLKKTKAHPKDRILVFGIVPTSFPLLGREKQVNETKNTKSVFKMGSRGPAALVVRFSKLFMPPNEKVLYP